MIQQQINCRKTLKPVRVYGIFCSQSPHILIVTFVVLNLRYGAMKIKQHAIAVVLNGNAPTITQHASHTANTQTNAEQ
jgi:hypothetical protein